MSDPVIASISHSALVLVDFDNTYDYDPHGGFSWLSPELNNLLSLVLSNAPTVTRIDVRLYGGWLRGGLDTAIASQLEAVIFSTPFFPRDISGTIVRGSITLAKSLILLPSLQWPDTHKEHAGLPRLRVVSNSTLDCINPMSCPIQIARLVTKHRNKNCPVSSCTVTNSTAFKTVEQKMVDTILSCDAIEAARSNLADYTFVVSDDADVIPAISMAASISGGQNLKLVQSSQTFGLWTSILSPLGISFLQHDQA